MSGKLCNGQPLDQPTTRNTRAYCEGRDVAAAGGLIGDVPHLHGPDKANWEAGFTSWAANPATGPPGDCCARPYGGGYTP